MNDTPTPIDLDNFPLNEALRFADENSTTGGLVTQAALKTLAAGCRELTAAREELAELKEEYGTWWAQKRIAIDELKEVTEQRDRLAEELKETKKRLKAANRGAEINAHALRINADKLATVTEQLNEMTLRWELTNDSLFDKRDMVDRLAEALQKLNEYDLGDIPVGVVRRCEEALQSLNPDHSVAANDMIADVKGGADEIPR